MKEASPKKVKGELSGASKLMKEADIIHFPEDIKEEVVNYAIDFSPNKKKSTWKVLHNAIFNTNFSKSSIMQEYIRRINKQKQAQKQKLPTSKPSHKRQKVRLLRSGSGPLALSSNKQSKLARYSKNSDQSREKDNDSGLKYADLANYKTLERIESVK